jgi:hypothetical protein
VSKGAIKCVFSLSSLQSHIWWYPEKQSSSVIVLHLATESTTAVEATKAVAVLATEISTQEAAATRDSDVAWVKDAEDCAALIEREARERVSRVEEESTAVLASAHEETESLVRKVALLEGELAEVHRAREVVEETACGLFATAANEERRWEESKRGHQEQLEELTLLQI